MLKVAATVAALACVSGGAQADSQLRGGFDRDTDDTAAVLSNVTVGAPTDYYGVDVSQPYGEAAYVVGPFPDGRWGVHWGVRSLGDAFVDSQLYCEGESCLLHLPTLQGLSGCRVVINYELV